METLRIENGAMCAEVSPRGGTITSFSVGGENIFYPRTVIGDKERGGCHVCAPWFGPSQRGDRKHGFARDSFMDGDRRPGAVETTFAYKGTDSRYPWWIFFEAKTSLENGSLRTGFVMTRNGQRSEPAPINPAFHPYFACSDATKVMISMGGVERAHFRGDSHVVRLKSKRIFIEMPDREITMDLGGDFRIMKSYLGIWTDDPGRYLCVEPILGKPELFDTPEGQFLRAERAKSEIVMNLTVVFK